MVYFPRNKADWVNGAHRYPRTRLIAEFSDKNREREKCKFTQNALLDGIAVRFNVAHEHDNNKSLVNAFFVLLKFPTC